MTELDNKVCSLNGLEDEIRQLEEKLKAKQEELNSVHENYEEFVKSSRDFEDELEKELGRSEKSVQDLTSQICRLKDELEKTNEKYTSSSHQITLLQIEVQNYKKMIQDMERKKRTLEQDLDDIQNQLRISQASEGLLVDKLEKAIEEKVYLQTEYDEDVARYELAVENLKAEIKEIQSTQQFSAQQDSLSSSQQDSLSSSQEDIQSSSQEDIQSSQQQDSLSSSQQDSLSSSQEDIQSSSQQDIQSSQQQDSLSSSQQDSLSSSQQDIQSSQQQIQQLELELQTISEKLIHREAKLTENETEISNLLKDLSDMKLVVENQQLEARNFQTTISQYNEAMNMKQKEIEQLTSTISMNQVKCLEHETQLAELRKKFEDEIKKNDKVQLEKDICDKETIIESLREKLTINVAKVDEYEVWMKKRHEQSETNNDEITKLSSLENQVVQQQTLIETLQKYLSLKETQINELNEQQKVLCSIDEIEVLRRQISALENENQRLRQLPSKMEVQKPNHTISCENPSRIENHSSMNTDSLVTVNSSEDILEKYIMQKRRSVNLLSRLQVLRGNIQVFCRVRPLHLHESEVNSQPIVDILNDSEIGLFDDRSQTWRSFAFDRALGPNESQQDIFEEVEPLVSSLINGFNGCVFAYGQTGSGKTYTMQGSEEDPGITIRFANCLFEQINSKGMVSPFNTEQVLPSELESSLHGKSSFSVSFAMLEIYNEEVRDLLNPNRPMGNSNTSNKLDIRYSPEHGGAHIPGLTTVNPQSAHEMLNHFKEGIKNRATTSTNVHDHSSRSHCVAIIEVIGTSSSDPINGSRTHGKFYLVDLAGSERVGKSEVVGEHLKEAQFINKSLSALGDVIEALDKKQNHVPYRNSKLTYLLQDALGGNSRTLMIIAVCPAHESVNETNFTLQFATRVRNITNGRLSKNPFLTAKKAEIQVASLKAELRAANKKKTKVEESYSVEKKEYKRDVEKLSSQLDTRDKAIEEMKKSYHLQICLIKKKLAEVTNQLNTEKESRVKETAERKELTSNLRKIQGQQKMEVKSKESLEIHLREREKEIATLRRLIYDTKRKFPGEQSTRTATADSISLRKTTSKIPRVIHTSSLQNLSSSSKLNTSSSSKSLSMHLDDDDSQGQAGSLSNKPQWR